MTNWSLRTFGKASVFVIVFGAREVEGGRSADQPVEWLYYCRLELWGLVGENKSLTSA